MKLGTETASLVNYIFSRGVVGEPAPEIGMGATLLSWTDRHPATIVDVVFSRGAITRIAVQEDNYQRVDSNGMSECQKYEFTPNLEAAIKWYAKDRKGAWVRVVKNESGRFVQSRGMGLRIGERGCYHDFSF